MAKHIQYRIQPVPKDNSCLFHCFSFAFWNQNSFTAESSLRLRNICADFVKHFDIDPVVAESVSTEKYKESITNLTQWGGGLEIELLSTYFNVQVKVCIESESRSGSKTFHIITAAGAGGGKPTQQMYLVWTDNRTHYEIVTANNHTNGLFPIPDTKEDNMDQEILDFLQPPPPPPLKFISRKNYFITASAKLNKQELCNQIVEKFKDLGKNKLIYVQVSEEVSSGTNYRHFHILIQFADKKQFNDPFWLDDLLQTHGNYQAVRNLAGLKVYIDKQDKKPATYGTYAADPRVEERNITKATKNHLWEQALAQPSITMALDLIAREAARDYLLHADRIESNLQRHFKRKRLASAFEIYSPPPYYDQPYDNVPAELTNWLATEFRKTERARMLILVGPTKTAKTSWARRLGPHMYFRFMWSLDLWDDQAEFIIFDDIAWTDFTPSQRKALFCAMGQITFTDKYRAKKTVNNVKPTIFLTNQAPVFDPQESSYWQENCVIVHITEPLCTTLTEPPLKKTSKQIVANSK
jgi:hypothetical protein